VYFVQLYRDKKVVGVFVRFRAPLQQRMTTDRTDLPACFIFLPMRLASSDKPART
jgi:hypothetical protein